MPYRLDIVTDFLMPDNNFFLIQEKLLEKYVYKRLCLHAKYTAERLFFEIILKRLLAKHADIQSARWGRGEKYLDQGGLFSAPQLTILAELSGNPEDLIIQHFETEHSLMLEAHSKLDSLFTRKEVEVKAILDSMVAICFQCIGVARIHHDTQAAILGLRNFFQAAPNPENSIT